jgi:hypothetical protein
VLVNQAWLLLIVGSVAVAIGVASLLRIRIRNRMLEQALSRDKLAKKLDPVQRELLAKQIREHPELREKLQRLGLGDLEENLTAEEEGHQQQ